MPGKNSDDEQASDRPITCLSDEDHEGDEITDTFAHYFGCIRFDKREHFYNNVISSDDQLAISTELRRVQFLRRTLENSEDDSFKLFVTNVGDSLEKYREKRRMKKEPDADPKEYHQRLKAKLEHLFNPNKDQQVNNDQYNPDKDMKAYCIFFQNGQGVTYQHGPQDEKICSGKFPNQKITVHDLLKHPDSPLAETHHFPERPRIRYFHLPTNNMQWLQETIAKYYNENPKMFDSPDRKVRERTRANTLLHGDIWLRQEHGRESSFLHARHMKSMCEQVSSSSKPTKLRADSRNVMLFMPYLHWDLDRQRKTFTSLIQEQATAYQNKLKADDDKEFQRRFRNQEMRKCLNGDTASNEHGTPTPNCISEPIVRTAPAINRKPTFSGTVLSAFSKKHSHLKEIQERQMKRDSNGWLIIKSRLGQLLYHASKLFEVMDNYRDRRLIDKYLVGDPPLHARRTLDQAYYWNLKHTAKRDRDQVVYRGTSAAQDHLHHYDPDTKNWNCEENTLRPMAVEHDRLHSEDVSGPPTRRSFRRRPALSAPPVSGVRGPEPDMEMRRLGNLGQNTSSEPAKESQEQKGTPKGCPKCRKAVQQSPRLIMVDQLWMWILNDTTIITCFPKRYGVNRKDASGVHKSIRSRLASQPDVTISSAYDLGLIVIDECCRVFHRAKTDRRQPQIIDIFSEAISEMALRQTIYFDHLWHWADELSKESTKRSAWVDLSKLHMALLNITPEGKLQRETKDIIEELNIMINLVKKQKEVLKRFKRHSESLLETEEDLGDPSTQTQTEEDPPRAGSRASSTPGLNPEYRTAAVEPSPPSFSRENTIFTLANVTPLGTLTFKVEDQPSSKLSTFRSHADRLLEETDDRLDELEYLHRTAEDVCHNINHLLDMKQQQASVVQAWQAIRHGEEAVKQGRAIMIFTVITIIFLPLAFMAAIFGMNNDVTANDEMPFSQQLKLIFSISVGVIFIVIIVAFSSFVRLIWWCTIYYCVNWLLVNLGLYHIWLKIPNALRAEGLIAWSEKQVNDMKDKVRKEVREEARREWEQGRKNIKDEEEKKKAEEAKEAAQQAGRHSQSRVSGVTGGNRNGAASRNGSANGTTEHLERASSTAIQPGSG